MNETSKKLNKHTSPLHSSDHLWMHKPSFTATKTLLASAAATQSSPFPVVTLIFRNQPTTKGGLALLELSPLSNSFTNTKQLAFIAACHFQCPSSPSTSVPSTTACLTLEQQHITATLESQNLGELGDCQSLGCPNDPLPYGFHMVLVIQDIIKNVLSLVNLHICYFALSQLTYLWAMAHHHLWSLQEVRSTCFLFNKDFCAIFRGFGPAASGPLPLSSSFVVEDEDFCAIFWGFSPAASGPLAHSSSFVVEDEGDREDEHCEAPLTPLSFLMHVHHIHITVPGIAEDCLNIDYMYRRPLNGGPQRWIFVCKTNAHQRRPSRKTNSLRVTSPRMSDAPQVFPTVPNALNPSWSQDDASSSAKRSHATLQPSEQFHLAMNLPGYDMT
ncbi:uncharacterized protein LACBIDRAFT_324574 [Laccaria bicolor S238N-H82]|uniref:Predicted protein n=1 Tax=Laccaria bicolor (strain S238N-H82 / ATCC MYA-4686) TaxID=486041 RepID=B0D2C3_LACBS|nr:uncharacterized protein LACBIDRAFT_324574 [Laccaria bicolor S238N-H82]EDR10722.1 predicted protein [Laccaria bicolor S238N-H82]|eukprot:XP_001878023.1 predicted protein [Laccaria bicolor S238N-H82]